MRRIAVVSLLITAVSMASSVEQLKKLLASPQATNFDDSRLAARLSEFRLKERLGTSDLAEIRKMNLGRRTAAMMELLADYTEFEPGAPDAAAPLSSQDAAALLDKTRNFAANYVRNLPDFLCTTIIRRFLSYPMSALDEKEYLNNLRLEDTISNEVSFENGRESYRAKTVNGQPTNKAVVGMTTMGEFGSILGSILGSIPIEGGAGIAWNHWESIDGRRLAVFRYSVDAAHSEYIVKWADDKHAPKQVKPAFSGEIAVDPVTGSIAHLTRHAALPRQAPMNFIDTVVEYRPVLIAGSAYICPVKSVTRSGWKLESGGFEFSLNETRFGSYHKFEGESKLAFDEPVSDVTQAVAEPVVAMLPAERVSDIIQIEPIALPAAVPGVKEPPPAPSGITLRSTTRLVEVSAVVVDKKGTPVTDLKKEDFRILDQGKQRSIRLFSAPASSAISQPAPIADQAAASAPRVFSNRMESGPAGSTPIIVLLDEGSEKFEEISFGRDRLIKFLRQAPPGQHVGLYRPIAHGVGIVHEFTKDSTDLVNIVQKLGFGPPTYTLQSSEMVDHRGNPWQGSPNAQLPAQPGMSGNRGHASDDPQHGLELHPCGAEYALEAITASANHAAGIPRPQEPHLVYRDERLGW